jgi:nitroimidazol reductase NimA-like FMN-containing flavoprotein (pyridoxamine 5'-phosphate oxidase superfamily)
MSAAPSPRSQVNRHGDRAHYDAETVHAILDEGFVGHVGFVDDGQPVVLPMLYARKDDVLYLHGSPRARMLVSAGGGGRLCLTVTLVDGLVLARSAFHHSINYRSVVVFGQGRQVTDRAEKLESMRILVDHIVPGRSADARGPSEGELKATEMVAMQIEEASAKVRTGPPGDVRKDLRLPVWGGVLPLSILAGEPIADEFTSVELPAYLAAVAGGDPRALVARDEAPRCGGRRSS